MSVDSDVLMDVDIEVIASEMVSKKDTNKKVSPKNKKTSVDSTKLTDTNTLDSLAFSPKVNRGNSSPLVKSAIKRRSYLSNKKKRLLNKHSNQECLVMGSLLQRKLKHVDTTTPRDLTMEVTALVKKTAGKLPAKLVRVLIDTGCSKTIVKATKVPAALLTAKRTSKPIMWKTNGGDFYTKYEVPLTIILPEFSPSMEVKWSCAIDENPEASYDMIIGRDLQHALQMDILWSTGSLTWNGMTIPMRTGQQKTENLFLEEIFNRQRVGPSSRSVV
jgi:hypothetical protein